MKTLFVNANPVLFDDSPAFDAFLVEDGKIVETGMAAKLMKAMNPDGNPESLVDLKGQPVIPGLVDAHIHLIGYAATKERNVTLKGVSSLEVMQQKIADFIKTKELDEGTWVSGSGWNHDLFPVREIPTKKDLDAVSPHHPMKLLRMCYHICVVNTKALELAGITKDTPDPEGGRIDRDAEGNPTGVLRETAMTLVDKAIPPLVDKEEIKALILSACEDLVSLGFTAVHTDDFGMTGDRQATLDAYMELDQEGKLPLDVVLQMITYEPEDFQFYLDNGLKTGRRFNRLVCGPIKILGDGSLGSRTAALKEPYSDDPNTSGFMLMSEANLDKMIRQAFDNGFDTAIHAIGDLTMETVLNLYEKYDGLVKQHGLKPAIIHSQIASAELLQQYKKLGVVANFQPIFTHSDWRIAEERVGPERLKYSYCWKTYLDMGIPCVGSSDAPVESFNPYYNLYTAVARKDLDGNPEGGWVPEEALSREEALKLFTLYPPMLTREVGEKGELKPGYAADFTVLSHHPYEVELDDLKKISAFATYKGGEKVYESPVFISISEN